MAKTKPIGVRFDEDQLKYLAQQGIAHSPQKALNFLSDFYANHKSAGTTKIEVGDLTKPTHQIKPKERPKTLDELKAMCPADLTGFDRSEWIARERQKYGI